MARYRKIDTRIWNDEKFRALSRNAKFAFVFILTHPNMTMLGAMRATSAGLAAELGFTPEEFAECFQEAVAQGMLKSDDAAAFVWLPRFLRYNLPESPSVVKSWGNALELIPECPLKDELIQRVTAFNGGLPLAFRNALPPVFRQAGVRVSDTLPPACGQGVPHQEQEPDQEPEQEQEQRKNAGGRASDGVAATDASPPAGAGESLSLLRRFPRESSGHRYDLFPPDVIRVIDHYNLAFTDLWSSPFKLSKSLAALVAARLKEHSVEEVCRAVTNIRLSKFHCGGAPGGKIIATPSFVFKDDQRVEEWAKAVHVEPENPVHAVAAWLRATESGGADPPPRESAPAEGDPPSQPTDSRQPPVSQPGEEWSQP